MIEETTTEADARRYRLVKSLKPYQYNELYKMWLQGEGLTFDQRVDAFDATVVERPLDEADIWGEDLKDDPDKF